MGNFKFDIRLVEKQCRSVNVRNMGSSICTIGIEIVVMIVFVI